MASMGLILLYLLESGSFGTKFKLFYELFLIFVYMIYFF